MRKKFSFCFYIIYPEPISVETETQNLIYDNLTRSVFVIETVSLNRCQTLTSSASL